MIVLTQRGLLKYLKSITKSNADKLEVEIVVKHIREFYRMQKNASKTIGDFQKGLSKLFYSKKSGYQIAFWSDAEEEFKRREIIFVSAPYNHPDEDVIASRISFVSIYCNKLIRQRKTAIAPVLIGHTIVENTFADSDFYTWEYYCKCLMLSAREIHVLKLKGWTKSKGVRAEISFAKQNGIKIKYIEVKNGKFR